MCFSAKSGTSFEVEILADGTVKVLTGDVSGPAHMAAEQFLQFLARELGGEPTRVKVPHAHVHDHAHGILKSGH